MTSIYIIKNRMNTEVYVGATTSSLKRRLLEHKSEARLDTGHGKLYEAIRLLGEDKFFIELLEICKDEDSRERETYWIKTLNSVAKGYNTKSDDLYLVYDIRGNFLSEETSFGDIRDKYNLSHVNLSSVITGKQYRVEDITIFNKFGFSEEDLKTRLDKIATSAQFTRDTPFEVYNVTGVLVGVFTSQTDCAFLLGLTRQKIGQCLRGKTKAHKGYTFKYITKEDW